MECNNCKYFIHKKDYFTKEKEPYCRRYEKFLFWKKCTTCERHNGFEKKGE